MKIPMHPPIMIAAAVDVINSGEIDIYVATQAKIIPEIPIRLPRTALLGDESPFKDRTKQTAATKKRKLEVILIPYFLRNMLNILYVTANPPKMFTEARTIAINPRILDDPYRYCDAAKTAPIIIMLEIALVTAIRGA